MVTSSAGMRAVDHKFVGSARNWTRAGAILARGDREEQGGGGKDHMVTGGSPVTMASSGRRPLARRRGCRGGGGRGSCPGGRRAHQEHEELGGEVWGGRTATNRRSDGSGRRGRDEVGGGNCGVPGPIPTEGRSSSARRRRRRHQLGSGRPESTAFGTAAGGGVGQERGQV